MSAPRSGLRVTACAKAAIKAGFHAAVYRSDNGYCHYKNIPQNKNRYMEFWEANEITTIFGYDIPGYDTFQGDGSIDLVIFDPTAPTSGWIKYYDRCDVCTMMVWAC